MKFNEIWARTNPVARFIFVLLILYAVILVIFMLSSLGVIDIIPSASEHLLASEYISVGFAMISFVFIVFISAFHLSTLIRRRKRYADKVADGKIKMQ